MCVQWPNFGGQLLSMQLGEGGVGLSQGEPAVVTLTLCRNAALTLHQLSLLLQNLKTVMQSPAHTQAVLVVVHIAGCGAHRSCYVCLCGQYQLLAQVLL